MRFQRAGKVLNAYPFTRLSDIHTTTQRSILTPLTNIYFSGLDVVYWPSFCLHNRASDKSLQKLSESRTDQGE